MTRPSSKSFHSRPRIGFALRLALPFAWFFVLALVVPVAKLPVIGGDEGVELTKAAYLLAGGTFDESVWNDQPITHTRLYAGLLALDYNPAGPRLWSLATSVLLLLAVGGLTRTLLNDDLAGLLAIVMVVLAPLVMELSVSAMQEVPANAFGIAAVWMAARTRTPPSKVCLPTFHGGRSPTNHANAWQTPPPTRGPDGCSVRGSVWEDVSWPRLALAALCATMGVAIKLTAALHTMAAFLMLAVREDRRLARPSRARIPRPSLVFLFVTLACSRILLQWVDGRSIGCLLDTHFLSFLAAPYHPQKNPDPQRWMYLMTAYPQIVLLFLLGSGLLLRVSTRPSGVDPRGLAVLPGLTVLFHGIIQPWWMFYSLSLWIALAPLAGFALAWMLRQVRGLPRNPLHARQCLPIALAGLVCLSGIASATSDLVESLATLHGAEGIQQSGILAALRRYAPSGAVRTLYSVSSTYAFWSRLRVPADLLVVTRKRVLCGDLLLEDLPRRVLEHDCDFVVTPLAMDPSLARVWNATLSSRYELTEVADGQQLFVHRRLHPVRFSPRLHW